MGTIGILFPITVHQNGSGKRNSVFLFTGASIVSLRLEVSGIPAICIFREALNMSITGRFTAVSYTHLTLPTTSNV